MAEGNRIALEVVTPDGVALRESVEELTAPSVDGDFGVLPGHRPLMAALRTGIAAYRQGTEEVRIAVGPGFAEVSGDKVVLLTDRFCRREDIDPVLVRQELREADDALDGFGGELGGAEHGQLIRRARWAAARLELYGDPPPPMLNTFAEFQTISHPDYGKLEEETSAEH
ncbi:MAG TPA: ATP synthase F1 subunit epsilon [Polyangiaceae bacterium]